MKLTGKLTALLLLCALLLTVSVPCLAAYVCVSPQKLTVDGTAIDCEKYSIDDYNYFKLRDLAYLLSNTGSRFSVGWDELTQTVSIVTGEAYAPVGGELVIGADQSATAYLSDQTILVNGERRSDLSAYNIGGNNYFKLRDLGTALGFAVDYDAATDTAIIHSISQGDPRKADPISLRSDHYALPSGTVYANVVTVDLTDPSVHIEAQHVDGMLNHTALFSDIVAKNQPDVAINANFFNSYDAVKDVIGALMCNGTYILCDSGIPSLGFTDSNETRWGVPPVFTELAASDGKVWAAYTVNTLAQSEYSGVLYTPARGSSIDIKANGYLLTVRGGRITDYAPVTAGTVAAIPADGYVMFMGTSFTATDYFRTPVVGTTVTLRPYLWQPDPEGFELEGVTQIVSGAPRLVRDGEICYELSTGFEEARFTTAVTARTAIGTTADGKLLLVNVTAASIQQMRELMLALGCTDATNLDGGASTAMYYRGNYLSIPGRELTSTLLISVR